MSKRLATDLFPAGTDDGEASLPETCGFDAVECKKLSGWLWTFDCCIDIKNCGLKPVI